MFGLDMSNQWIALKKRLESEIEHRRGVVGGSENFYRLQGLKEVRDWMQEINSLPPVKDPDAPERILMATGVQDGVHYEVARYPRSKEYRAEYSDGRRKKITISDAVRMAQKPFLGQPGGSAFDKAYQQAHGS